MTTTAASTFATEQIAGTWPTRAETVRFDLLNRDRNVLGELMVDRSQTASITIDTSRRIFRSADELTVQPRPFHDQTAHHYYASDLDVLTQMVRPVWVYPDGTEYHYGLFLFADDARAVYTWGSPRHLQLADLSADLDTPLSLSVGYGATRGVFDALQEQCDLEGIPTENRYIEVTGAALSEAIGWTAGRDTRLDVFQSLCSIAGFLPPYFDNEGNFVCRSAPDLASATAAYAYGAGGTVIPDTVLLSSGVLAAPNRYIVVSNDADTEIIGTFDVPNDAPNSYAKIGKYRVQSDYVQGIESTTIADQVAQANYAKDPHIYQTLTFDSIADPRQDTWDVVSFSEVVMLQTKTIIECRAGGVMHHECRSVYESDAAAAIIVESVGRQAFTGSPPTPSWPSPASLWTPADLPNLLDWWLADDAASITESGGSVSAWAGQEGLYTFTESTNKPTTGGATINSLNCISFDGANQLLRLTGLSSFDVATFYLVFKRTETAATVAPFGATGTDFYLRTYTASTRWGHNQGTFLDSGIANNNTSAHSLVVVFAAGASSVLYVDGVAGTSGNAGTNSATNILLGTRDAVHDFTAMDLAAIAVDLGVPSSPQLNGWAAYVSRWGL